jgi:hypothetical protein
VYREAEDHGYLSRELLCGQIASKMSPTATRCCPQILNEVTFFQVALFTATSANFRKYDEAWKNRKPQIQLGQQKAQHGFA